MGRETLAGRLFERRFHVTNVIAVVCHLLAFAFIATREAPRAAPAPAPPPEDTPITVELDTAPPAPPPPPTNARPEPIAAPAPPATAALPRKALSAAPAARSLVESNAAATATMGDGTIDAPPAPQAAPPSAPSAKATAIPDGLPPPLIPRAIRAPAAVLEIPLAAQPGQTSTSASGQVTAAVYKAAELKGPAQGHATIRITVDEDGTVSGVVASGAGWEGAAQAIRAALAGRRLRVPKGAHGLVISFAADAVVTRVPPVLTGEARAQPMRSDTAAGKGPPTDDEHRGMHPAAPNMAVIDPRALLPIPRRVVKLEMLGEQPR